MEGREIRVDMKKRVGEYEQAAAPRDWYVPRTLLSFFLSCLVLSFVHHTSFSSIFQFLSYFI